jgi:hypothetical protein
VRETRSLSRESEVEAGEREQKCEEENVDGELGETRSKTRSTTRESKVKVGERGQDCDEEKVLPSADQHVRTKLNSAECRVWVRNRAMSKSKQQQKGTGTNLLPRWIPTQQYETGW